MPVSFVASSLLPAAGAVLVLVGLGLVVLGLAGVAHRHTLRGLVGTAAGLAAVAGGLGLLGLL